jgi:hypothetical protein
MARAEHIEVMKRLFLFSKTEKGSLPAAVATVLFDNAAVATSAEGGLTRDELADAVTEILVRSGSRDPAHPVIPDEINTPLVRMAAKLDEFSEEQLPLLGVTRIKGPTKTKRDDTVTGKIWLQLEFEPRDPDADAITAAIIEGAAARDDGPEVLAEVARRLETGQSQGVMFARAPGKPTLLILTLVTLMSVGVALAMSFPTSRKAIESVVQEFFGPEKPEPEPPVPTPKPRTSNPIPPPVLSLPGAGRDVQSFLAVGNRIFVAAGAAGLKVVEVGDNELKVIGKYAALPVAQDVVVANGTAFVTTGTAGIAVLDVSDTSNITRITTIRVLEGKRFDGSIVHGSAHALALHGSLLAVAEGSGFSLHDVADPRSPVRLGQAIINDGSAIGIAMTDGVAIIATHMTLKEFPQRQWFGAGIESFDISNPQAPVSRQSRSSAANAEQVVLNGRTIYMALSRDGLQVVEVGVSGNLINGEWWKGFVTGVALTPLGLLATTDKGVARFNVDDPARPIFQGFIEGAESHPLVVGSRLCAVSGDDINCTLLDRLTLPSTEPPPSKPLP